MAVVFADTHQKKIQLWSQDAWKRLRALWGLRLRICGVGTNGSDTWVTAQPLQNVSPHPSALALSGDLSYPKPYSHVWSGLKPWNILSLWAMYLYLGRQKLGWSLSAVPTLQGYENWKKNFEKIHLVTNFDLNKHETIYVQKFSCRNTNVSDYKVLSDPSGCDIIQSRCTMPPIWSWKILNSGADHRFQKWDIGLYC